MNGQMRGSMDGHTNEIW